MIMSMTRRSVVPLVSMMIIAFFILVAFIYYQYASQHNTVKNVLNEEAIYSQKMRINSELMELARSRTRLTSKIIDTEDPFVQDELNMELEGYASRFAQLRNQLSTLPLNATERKILNSHKEIVTVILPAQRRAVELAFSREHADKEKARQLLYKVVLPGQGELIRTFGELVSLEQNEIVNLSQSSKQSLDEMNRRINST